MDKHDKVAVSIIMAGSALAGLIAVNALEKKPEETKEIVAVHIPSPGTFHCEYYKAKTQVVEDVYDYHVVSANHGWNWVLEMNDGTTLYYSQTAGQFCYVAGDADED